MENVVQNVAELNMEKQQLSFMYWPSFANNTGL